MDLQPSGRFSFVYYMDVDSSGKRNNDKVNCEESTIMI